MSAIWPKTYLINLLNKAVAEGSCRVDCIDSAQARSLASALNRIRRRKDRSHDAFITAEHHMVTAAAQGSQLFVVYSVMPSGMVLPEVHSSDGASLPLEVRLPEPKAYVAPATSGGASHNIDAIMADIARRAFSKGEDDSGESTDF